MSCQKCDKGNKTRRILEDLQDRASKIGLPEAWGHNTGLTSFTDYKGN